MVRPTKPEGEKRTKNLKIHFTQTELELLWDLCHKLDMTQAAVVRMAIGRLYNETIPDNIQ